MAKKTGKSGKRAKRNAIPPMTPLMRFYFDAWLGRSKLFGDRSDEHYFFLFVKACLRRNAACRDGHWLRKQLEKEGNIQQQWIDKAVEWFDICVDYDDSAAYFRGSKNHHQFNWRPNDRRPWKVKLKEEDERASRRD